MSRFTNGPAYVDYLASNLNVGIQNFANGSATTRDVARQIGQYLRSHQPSAGTLFVGSTWGLGGSLLGTKDSPEDLAAAAVENFLTLMEAGGTQFLIADLTLFPQLAPSLKEIPEVEQISATMGSILQTVHDELSTLTAMHDVSVTWIDQDDLFQQLIGDPSAFGITNVTDPVMDLDDANKDEYLWWDGLHWTTAGHRIVADFTLRRILADFDAPCDFDDDRSCSLTDIDLLAKAIARRTNPVAFDLSGNGIVDQTDLELFLDDVNRLNGDANFDGEVTFEDFLALSANFGKDGKTWSDGDFVATGVVDFEDFLVLSSNFGRSSTNITASVPEPRSAWLVILIIAVVGVVRTSRVNEVDFVRSYRDI